MKWPPLQLYHPLCRILSRKARPGHRRFANERLQEAVESSANDIYPVKCNDGLVRHAKQLYLN